MKSFRRVLKAILAIMHDVMVKRNKIIALNILDAYHDAHHNMQKVEYTGPKNYGQHAHYSYWNVGKNLGILYAYFVVNNVLYEFVDLYLREDHSRLELILKDGQPVIAHITSMQLATTGEVFGNLLELVRDIRAKAVPTNAFGKQELTLCTMQ